MIRLRSTLTIIGLYNWDPDIFNALVVPDQVNKDLLIDNIVLECSDLELTVPNADLFQRMLYSWSRSRLDNWERIAETLEENYDPLHNYDRTEDITREWDATNGNTRKESSSGQDVTTNRTAAFNGDTLAKADDSTIAYGGKADTTDSGSEKGKQTDKIRAYGNIGITTSQAMAIAEVNLRSEYCIYDIIIADFKKTFCVLVY